MANAYLIPSSSISSPLFQYSSSLTTSKQMFAVFICSTILMFIVVITMVLCFIDCIHKKTKQNHPITMIKSNGINNNHHQNSIPLTKNFYGDDSSTNHYKSLKSTSKMKPVIVIASSNSHSTSSVDSTTRTNTALNRAITNTYTYTALSTSDDLMPVDFDDNINDEFDDNGVELMMTTV